MGITKPHLSRAICDYQLKTQLSWCLKINLDLLKNPRKNWKWSPKRSPQAKQPILLLQLSLFRCGFEPPCSLSVLWPPLGCSKQRRLKQANDTPENFNKPFQNPKQKQKTFTKPPPTKSSKEQISTSALHKNLSQKKKTCLGSLTPLGRMLLPKRGSASKKFLDLQPKEKLQIECRRHFKGSRV